MSSVWKGTLNFGLVSIPVKVSTAARTESIGFNQLHKTCHGRIKQKLHCPTCDVEITRADCDRGYEVAKDQYIVVTDEELEACETESNKIMEITEMVEMDAVDPLLFDASYFLAPELAGHKGYKLLYDALVAEGRYAIARLTMSKREQIAVIRPYRGVLTFSTMFMVDEIHDMPAVKLDTVALKPAELELARRLVQVNAAEFDHAKYTDGYRVQVGKLIEAKAAGEPVLPPVAVKRREDVVDIMEALSASLAVAKAPAAAPAAAAKPAARRAKKDKVA